MARARDARHRRRSLQFRQLCDAIGRELRANYLPISTQPIPDELRGLLTRLVALEAQTERAGESLHTQVIRPPRG